MQRLTFEQRRAYAAFSVALLAGPEYIVQQLLPRTSLERATAASQFHCIQEQLGSRLVELIYSSIVEEDTELPSLRVVLHDRLTLHQ